MVIIRVSKYDFDIKSFYTPLQPSIQDPPPQLHPPFCVSSSSSPPASVPLGDPSFVI